MNVVTRSALGAAVAAGAMYFFDPISGRRRRLILRDQCSHTAKRLELGTRDARHDISHHVGDLAGKTKAHLTHGQTSDKAICKNVKHAIERSISEPKAIDCAVRNGNVFLRGDVLTNEHQRALDETRGVHGVRVVTDHLTPREPAEGVRRIANGNGHDGWSVAGRVLVGAGSCALLLWGVKERKAISAKSHDLWERSKREVTEKLEQAKDVLELGQEEVQALAQDAAEAAVDVGDSIVVRAREREREVQDSIRTHAAR
jgi:gas vesicle protein